MAKRNRLLEKLVRASGGWETFLYQTLKEVCEKVSLNGFTGDGEYSVEEAMDVLVGYEACRLDASISLEESIVNVKMPKVKVDPIGLNKIVTPVKSTIPVAPSVVEPRKLTGKIAIDNSAGASQGSLPVPQGFRLVNRHQMVVATTTGMIIATSNADGQIKDQNVSGHISSKGDFRLVFTDVNMGTAIIHFEVLPIPPAPPAPVRPENYVPVDPKLRDVALREAAKAEPVDPPRPEGGVKEVG